MKISKEKANQAAMSMVQDKREKANEINQEISKLIEKAVKRSVPKAVKTAFELHPNFIRKSLSFSPRGLGIDRPGSITVSKEMPSTGRHGATVQLNIAEAEDFINLSKKRDDITEKTAKVEKNIYNAILALGTYKRVEENFPEAFPHLPTIENRQVVVQVKDIVNELKTI